MTDQAQMKNAVAAIRVSTLRQGVEGDSPDDQLKQIEQFAAAHHARVVKPFIFMESASKEMQPMQEAINYCKDPKNNVQLFIVKSIDRFTRAGFCSYDMLKTQLDDCGVALVDSYGVISTQKVNTLAHLGVKYKWSEYSPTHKAEMLEAERAKDEVRDIQTRMIGAQIRYARMGYWVRRPLYGFDNIHIETREGKRCILQPNKKEAPLVVKMFELRARNTIDDIEIVKTLNTIGFRTRERAVRDKEDRSKILYTIGGEPLTLKTMWGMIENPVYAGVNPEKWTQGKPVKCMFDGLVSPKLFNAANRGKLTIIEDEEGLRIHKRRPQEHLLNKGVRNADFPFKRIVLCPTCRRPLFGSASKGKRKYYPAYHCDKRGHYFRKPKPEFDQQIETFVKCINVSAEYWDALFEIVCDAFDKQQLEIHSEAVAIDLRIAQIRTQIRQAMDKIKFLTSETTVKYMEEDILKLENEINDLLVERQKAEPQEATDMEKMKAYVRYFAEHLEELLFYHCNPVLQAKLFGVIFNDAPTYDEIVGGTPDCRKITGINKLFVPKNINLDSWLGMTDSNRRSRDQNPLPYHLANPQCTALL